MIVAVDARQTGPPAPSSDNRSKKLPDAGGERHRQGAPECHPKRGTQNLGAAGARPDRTQNCEKGQRRSGHDGHQGTCRRYDHHEQRHDRPDGERGRRGQRGLHRTRGGDFRNAKLVTRVGSQGIFRRQLAGNLPRQRLIDATLDVDFGKLIKLKPGVLFQLLAFARKIRPLGVGLRADLHIFAGGHRHGARH